MDDITTIEGYVFHGFVFFWSKVWVSTPSKGSMADMGHSVGISVNLEVYVRRS